VALRPSLQSPSTPSAEWGLTPSPKRGPGLKPSPVCTLCELRVTEGARRGWLQSPLAKLNMGALPGYIPAGGASDCIAARRFRVAEATFIRVRTAPRISVPALVQVWPAARDSEHP
jgi:hypothetical protein